MRNSLLIGSQVAILGIHLLVGDIDFIYNFISGEQLWGIAKYFLLGREITLGRIISLQYLFIVLLALYSMFLIKVKRFDFWKISIIQITLYYIVIYFITNPIHNINCIFNPCVSIMFGQPYVLTWFIIFFSFIFITNCLIYFVWTRYINKR